jgi:putative transposase
VTQLKQFHPGAGMGKLCALFGKSRQAYYDLQNRSEDTNIQEYMIIQEVNSIRKTIPGAGGLKLHRMLAGNEMLQSFLPGRDRFYDMLRAHKLLIKQRKSYIRTTNSNHPYFKWPDLIKDISVTSRDRLWVSDITFLRLVGGSCFLSLVTDAYSRKIVGYHLSQTLKAQGCIIALQKALDQLSDSRETRNLIHHSDRGVQYCCHAYVSILQEYGVNISMTQDGNPYDNAMAERVNGLLKHTFGLGNTFTNYSCAVAAVAVAVHAYNFVWPHGSVSNLPANQAHESTEPLQQMWKKRKKWKQKMSSEPQPSICTQLYPQMASGNPPKISSRHLVDKVFTEPKLEKTDICQALAGKSKQL